jgi:uncharacterized membrane protein YvbJ
MAQDDAPKYTWVCQHCGHSSPGGTLSCANCGFPVHTSAFEIERAKQLRSIPAFLAERQVRRDKWRSKPLPKKVLVVVAVPMFGVSLILLRFAWGWANMALGAAIIAASLLFFWFGR